ncbi:NAD(P)-binding protein [Cylindrobasidium torrendii FP15055 ss-10]|uniref:NAD(P)-binding protein n=1 Tax=Cylindrobasidium torrendii FP15055 ss-10 TaxID=1314674 RepID=A0A0D7AZE8_9AGAR|nr:NAD(P)-binding protein [Cylindrobasidium torrendii FP15055 ss-10]
MSLRKDLVLVVGATGRTGSVLVKELIKSGDFRVAILVRKESIDKPLVQEHIENGAELRVGDISEPEEVIEGYLRGVDILVSLVLPTVDQKPLLRAARQVGTLSRVVPSDFGPMAPRGIAELCDMVSKRDTHEFVHELGLPYTFIEAAWWQKMLLPLPQSSYMTKFLPPTQKQSAYVGDIHKRITISTLGSIGIFTAKILADPRTLNQTVLIHDGDMSIAEAHELSRKVTGKDFSDCTRVPDDVVYETLKSSDFLVRLFAQYQHVIYLRNDNDLSTLPARGVLDARELYPEVPPLDMEAETRDRFEEVGVLGI